MGSVCIVFIRGVYRGCIRRYFDIPSRERRTRKICTLVLRTVFDEIRRWGRIWVVYFVLCRKRGVVGGVERWIGPTGILSGLSGRIGRRFDISILAIAIVFEGDRVRYILMD